jgi:hypothetical protein
MGVKIQATMVISVAAVLGSLAGRASAQNWLVGGSIGQSDQDGYQIGLPVTLRHDSGDTSWEISGGYLFNDWFGLKASYIDFGAANYAGVGFGGFTDRLDATGLEVAAYFTKALGSQQRVSIFGDVGVIDFEQKVDYSDLGGRWSGKDTGTSPLYGIGFSIPLGDRGWAFHGEYKMYSDIGDAKNSGHEYDRSVVQFGVHFVLGASDD